MYDDHRFPGRHADAFKEAVSIEAQRIFDTYSERDLICGLTVVTDEGCTLPENVNAVKTRCAEVSNICISVDEVPFKDGYYAVDITYTFSLSMDAYEFACTDESVPISGKAVWNKRVILYGSRSNIRTFSSGGELSGDTDNCCKTVNLPKVTVSVVEPIALETKVDSTGCAAAPSREIKVTLGLFSVIRLTRSVPMLIPTYDYSIPDRECRAAAETPQEVFGRLDFPSEEFFPESCPLPSADIPPVRTDELGDEPPADNSDI